MNEIRATFWFVIGVAVAVILLTTSIAFANCTTQTIMMNGKIIVCTVCYDFNGRPTSTICNG